ncbi:chloramphenicol phosphotransferase CPT family protein [Cupriavidus necator]
MNPTEHQKPARIVILNGVGSAGKTSIAKALQAVAIAPFLRVEMDVFIDMLPEPYREHPDGFAYETVMEAGQRQVIVKTGPLGERTLRGMRHAIAAMAAQGNNVIVDEVLLGEERREYADLLACFEVVIVGVFAPLDVLEARESARGDRHIGLARWQFERVHKAMVYDLVVDTSRASPLACAKLIQAEFRL